MRNDEKKSIQLKELAKAGRFSAKETTSSLQSSPYWKQDSGQLKAHDKKLPASADVVIVGSGFTGLSAALTLARAGRSVVVSDAQGLGAGASTRNGGQIGSGNQKFRVKKLIQIHGEKKAVSMLHEGVAMLDYLEELIKQEKIECHFNRCGRFRGAVRPEHYDAMAHDMDDLYRHVGVESFAVPKSEQHKEIASDYFHGGSVLPNDGSVHPGLLHSGLVDRCKDADVSLHGHKPVTFIEKLGTGSYEVTSGNEVMQARNVLIATNGYTKHIEPFVNKRIVTVQSAVITTDVLSDSMIKSLMPTGRMYGNSARMFFYFRASPTEPRMMWGGRVSRLHKPGSPSAYSHLARDLLDVFPVLEGASVTHGWSGNIGYTFDELPHLGETPDGVHYAMGYCGTGVSRSIYFGNKIALKILGDPSGQTEFDEIDFPSHPFHAFANSAVPLMEGVYRVKDKFN